MKQGMFAESLCRNIRVHAVSRTQNNTYVIVY